MAKMSQVHRQSEGGNATRRGFLALLAMSVGLILSYGVLAVEGFLFLLPERLQPKVRWLFAGRLDSYKEGSVQVFLDLKGNQILVKRNPRGVEAFSSICPHLGCRVHWVPDKREFLCPCHNGIFDAEGKAISGPPADAGQSLALVPVNVDQATQVVYIGVKNGTKV